VVDFVRVDTLEPVLSFAVMGRAPRLRLNADAQTALRDWFGSTAPLRVSIVRSSAEPSLIAVGIDDYGVLLDVGGYASGARFVKRLGLVLPLSITLSADHDLQLLIGRLPKEMPVPLRLPPLENAPPGSIRQVIRQVSTQPLPAETVEHEDTIFEDDDEGDDGDDEGEDE
jgi:hypothetical protein